MSGKHAALTTEKTYRKDIDGLRALSIILVVAFHAGWARFAGGYVGVDVFFVISGYLITGLLVKEFTRTGRISLADFYARRIRRLLPLAGLVLVSTLTLGLLLLPPLSRTTLLADVRAAALYVANWRFAGQATAYSDADVTESLLLHYWSLSVEEQFYFVWPLLVILVGWIITRRRRPDLFVPALGVALGIVVVGSLSASIAVTERLGPEAYYVTYTRLWEMGVGAGLALLVPRLRKLPQVAAEVAALGGGALILYGALFYDATTAFPGTAALLPVGGTALLIVTASRQGTILSRFFERGPLPYLGRVSYAWYLWHWPLIGAALLLAERYGLDWPTWIPTGAAVALSLVLAAVSHVLVENPLRHAAWLRVSVRRSLAFGACLTALPVAAVLVFWQFGNTGGEQVIAMPDPEPVPDRASPEDEADDADEVEKAEPGGGVAEAQTATMTPRQAADDAITVGPEGCHIEQAEDDANPSCVLGDPDGDRTVVLYGDSHARHWLPALDIAAKERGWRVITHTKSACSPVDTAVWNSNFERVYDECATWRADVVEELAAERPVDLVIMSKSYSYRVIDEDGSVAGRSRAAELWRDGAARTFTDLLSVADQVVVLRDTPWSEEDVPTCLSESPSNPSACALDLAERGGLDQPLHDVEREVAPQGVRFLDPTGLVCADDPCQMVTSDGMIKYHDRHHLTQTFSRSLGPAFGDMLEEVLVGGPS